MNVAIRRYPPSRLLNISLLLAGVLAAPFFFIVLFGKWAESPMRQLVGFAALFSIFALALIRNKQEVVAMALLFLSQFMISLMSFDLTKPVILPILAFDILLFILLFRFVEMGERFKVTSRIGWIFLALILWQFAISYLSAHPTRSVIFSIQQLKYFLLYLMISNIAFSDRFYRRLPWLLSGILVIQTALALLQYAGGGYLGLAVLGERDPSQSEQSFFGSALRASGTLGATNSLGGYLAIALVFLLPYILTRFNLIRYGVFVFGLIGLVIPLSRAGWLSFLVGAAIVALQMLRSKLISPVKVIAMGMLAVLLMGGVVYAKRDVIMERFEDKAAVASASGRLGQFPYAIEMSMKNPIFGIGPGLSSFFGSWNNFDQYIRDAEQVQDVKFREQVHNAFLQYFLESGLPGAILFAILCLSVMLHALHKTKRASPHELARIGAAAAAFAFILHTQFGTEINNQQMMLLFAFALGISTNKYLLSSRPIGQPPAAPTSIR